jgi:uncharacterized membrane protein
MFIWKEYFMSLPLLFFVDLFWLGTAGRWAIDMTEKIQKEPVQMRYGAGAIVYFALAYILSYAKNVSQAFMLGLSSYAVYDFTSYAILKLYDWRLAVADSLWGGVLFSLVFLALAGLR